ncbi:MAG: hypothetical protein K2N24_09140 [Lachnospiraceae bacterium]|nr:hypothetical protein [Lachnospiraceae bacterium]
MADYQNARCSICGQAYHICNSCSGRGTYTPWRTVACSMDCYQLFLALNSYTNGYATQEETRTLLEQLDLSRFSTLEEHIQTSIRSILSDDISGLTKNQIPPNRDTCSITEHDNE